MTARRRVLLGLLALLVLAAAVQTGRVVGWWDWHGDKQATDRAVDAAINEPGGGDYAEAADLLRASSRPDPVKRFQIGQLVADAYMLRSPRRPPESLEEGVRMMEDATVAAGDRPESGPQYLRMLFEADRNAGQPRPFPADDRVSACWRAIEEHRRDDRQACIALRRQRLPMPAATG